MLGCMPVLLHHTMERARLPWLLGTLTTHCLGPWRQGLVLLTGPNMAGKSTVLRSAAAAALLASCGKPQTLSPKP